MLLHSMANFKIYVFELLSPTKLDFHEGEVRKGEGRGECLLNLCIWGRLEVASRAAILGFLRMGSIVLHHLNFFFFLMWVLICETKKTKINKRERDRERERVCDRE